MAAPGTLRQAIVQQDHAGSGKCVCPLFPTERQALTSRTTMTVPSSPGFPKRKILMLNTAIDLMERGRIPDWLTRIGIRRLLAERLRTDNGHNPQARDVESGVR
jgi:hypothetical protein